jgi:hypothetical protein
MVQIRTGEWWISMTYRGKKQTYLCMLVMIAVLVITVPALASDDIVGCGTPTPTPTPTPCPTPVTPPSGPFACPEGVLSLVTANGDVVGCVAVSNDRISLNVKFTANPAFHMKTANWTYGLEAGDITLDANGVPALDTFPYNYAFADGEMSHQFPPVDISKIVPQDIDHLVVSAHAAIEKKDIQTCQWIYSDGTETFKAYSNPKAGSDTSLTPRTRSGTAVMAWAPNADSSLYLRGTSSSSRFTFAKANWIWESYRVMDPWRGDIVDFTKTFALAGTPVSGTLWITADDGYDVSLNTAGVGNHGLLGSWRTSDLKYSFVPGHGIWKSVEKYDISQKLVQGTNTLLVQTANRYMGCDNPIVAKAGLVGVDETLEVTPDMITNGVIVGCANTCAEPKGTIDSNVGALKYEAYICTATPSTTDAWVLGDERNTKGELVKYFSYQITKVDFALLPDPSTGQLPGGASQTVTATAFDQLGHRIPGLLLTFSTDFGTFSGDNQLMTAKTDANGETKVTVTSQVAGTAALTVWTDTNQNKKLDPGEWTSSSTIIWKPALVVTSMGLSPGMATRQLPAETTQAFTVNVVDQYGMPMPDVLVTFSTDAGSFDGAAQASGMKTDLIGRATVIVTSTSAGKATIAAKAGDISAISTVTWLPEPRIPSITLLPLSASVQLPLTSQSLTAMVVDQYGKPIDGTQVTFTTSFGTFDGAAQSATVTAGANGEAAVTVTSMDAGTATVTATAGVASGSSSITWVSPQPDPVSTPEPTPETPPDQG